MASDRPRFSITVSSEMYKYINDYQHANKLATQTKAITQILQIGLDSLETANGIQTTKKSSAPVEPETVEHDGNMQALLEVFSRLNEEGQEKLLDYADDLVQSGKYIKSDSARAI